MGQVALDGRRVAVLVSSGYGSWRVFLFSLLPTTFDKGHMAAGRKMGHPKWLPLGNGRMD